ncbi:MAG: hypothetical protein O7E52_29165 [Candidatus Poribacteria bacterium]|nr:hypothetical protein [Candidatus Poribacteria bacterium]
MSLTQEQVEQYVRDGFLVVNHLFSEAEIEPLRLAVDDVLEEVGREAIAAGKSTEGLFSSGVYVGLSLRRVSGDSCLREGLHRRRAIAVKS